MNNLKKPVNIIFVITTVDGYGADRSILENILYLTQNNYISPFVVLPKKGNIERILKTNNIPYKVFKFNSFIKGQKFLKYPFFKRNIKLLINIVFAFLFLIFKWSKLNFRKTDLVYTNTFTTFYGIILSKILRSKHITHIREIPKEQFAFEYEYGEKRSLECIDKNSDKIFCNSTYTLKYFSELIDNERVVFVPNPIYHEKEVDKIINNTLIGSVISFVLAGRYEDSKNQMDAIEAVKILVDKGVSNFVLDLYGNGPLKRSYINYIKEYNLESYINIYDFAQDLPKILPNYNVGLICSRYEAFGRITVEYISNGLAVIGNETGNTPYLIKDGLTGLIYQFKQPETLASRMEYFLNNPNVIRKMSEAAQTTIKNEYSIERSSQKIFEEIKEVL